MDGHHCHYSKNKKRTNSFLLWLRPQVYKKCSFFNFSCLMCQLFLIWPKHSMISFLRVYSISLIKKLTKKIIKVNVWLKFVKSGEI